MIKFSIGGRDIDPRNLEDALMGAVLESFRTQITEKIGSIRDPETGEFPTVVVRGSAIEHLTLHVEGSPKLVALVRERLGMEQIAEGVSSASIDKPPSVFLSYTSDNFDLAKRTAEALEAAGVETWWDKWCINPGDSLRRKIDEGIAGCTHFLVLLTPESITKPWVNLEMDAGLVRSLNDQCRFLPVRYNLSTAALPPLLSGLHSPSITSDEDIAQLINDIYGVNRRPQRGTPPAAVVRTADVKTGYSPAATAIAQLFVERTKFALFADPQFDVESIAKETAISREDVNDALYELSGFLKLSSHHVLVQGTLFAEFDRYWMPWNAADDAKRLAADIISDPKFPHDPAVIAAQYGWEPRRLNPVIYYMLERRLIDDFKALGTAPFAMFRIVGNEHMRRFVKGRL